MARLQGVPSEDVAWWNETMRKGETINFSDIAEIPHRELTGREQRSTQLLGELVELERLSDLGLGVILLRTFEGEGKAAAHTGIPRGTLYRLVNKHDIVPGDFRG